MAARSDSIRVVADPDELVELYARDPHLHIYALADLEEPYWSQSTWWRDGDAAVGLVGLPDGEQVVYAVSSVDPNGTLQLVAEIQAELGPGLVTGVRGIAEIFESAGRTLIWRRGYHRYHLTSPELVPNLDPMVERLGPADVDEAAALYATEPGAAFFLPSMMNDQTFVGVRSSGQLVSIAGTHVLSETHGVAAVGAVFTHPDHRGRGLGTMVTAGAVHQIGDRVAVIGLNCTDANTSAIGVYKRMGFEAALAYDETELG